MQKESQLSKLCRKLKVGKKEKGGHERAVMRWDEIKGEKEEEEIIF